MFPSLLSNWRKKLEELHGQLVDYLTGLVPYSCFFSKIHSPGFLTQSCPSWRSSFTTSGNTLSSISHWKEKICIWFSNEYWLHYETRDFCYESNTFLRYLSYLFLRVNAKQESLPYNVTQLPQIISSNKSCRNPTKKAQNIHLSRYVHMNNWMTDIIAEILI